MRNIFSLLFFSIVLGSNTLAQDSLSLDKKYLEDQFYVGITYNFLLNKPSNVTQRNLSYGLQGGFIKDIPLNLKGTIAVGAGIGFALNTYYSNLRVTEVIDVITYDVLGSDINFKRNKLETHIIEFPIEFRWRDSTPEEYKFWRIYAGMKFGYIIGARSKFRGDTENTSFFNTDVRNFQYGLTFNFGYNTFNIHAYYSLNKLFDDNILIDSEYIVMKPLRIGLIFYIL